MEKAGQQLEDLNDKLEALQKRIGEGNPQEINMMEGKLAKEEGNLSQLLKDVEELRQKRQKALVIGSNVDSISKSITECWQRVDLTEDAIMGIRTRIRELHSEKEVLAREKDLCRDEIIKVKIKGFIPAINTNLKQASDLLKGLLSVFDEYNLEWGPNGWGKFVECSSWPGLRVVPSLAMKGDQIGKDFVNFTEIATKRNQEAMERHAQTIRDARKEK
jgi:DNA repair exonuclease SbcCD ATPase subunit